MPRHTTAAGASRTGAFEERGIDRLVERDLADPPFEDRFPSAEDFRGERHLHAVDGTVIAELLLDQRPLAATSDVRLFRDQRRIGIYVQHDRLEAGSRELERVTDDSAFIFDVRQYAGADRPAFGGDQQGNGIALQTRFELLDHRRVDFVKA